jgi:XTP/dITP diphosphohydrolase
MITKLNTYTLITQNKHKIEEFERILGKKIKYCDSIDLSEIQSLDVEKVVIYKVKEAYQKLNVPVMVEDTGLFIDEWGGLPGAFMSWFHKCVGEQKLCRMMKDFGNRKAIVKTVLAIQDSQTIEPLIFVGEVEGDIAREPLGELSFGFDSIFIPRDDNKQQLTFAQMGKEKDRYSMRKKALSKFIDYINAP